MSEIIITIIKFVILFFLAYEVYQFMRVILEKDSVTKFPVMTKNAVSTAIGKAKSRYLSEDNLRSMMSRYGLMHLLHDYNIDAATFVIVKVVTGLLLGALGQSFVGNPLAKLAIFVVGVIVGFFIPDFIIKENNKSDNDAMLDDIINVYTMLKIHATSGVYITDSLIECQRAVANPRLKESFTELNNNILSRKITIEEAVDLFNSRFESDHIDNLSVIIKQSLKTGRSSEVLTDISKQIEDTNRLRAERQKEKMRKKMTIMQVVFFIIITIIALYLVVQQMLSSMANI